ncbi:MAG: hypothetical protein ABH821_00835 [archaeon]
MPVLRRTYQKNNRNQPTTIPKPQKPPAPPKPQPKPATPEPRRSPNPLNPGKRKIVTPGPQS